MSRFARFAPETGESVVFNITVLLSLFGRSPLRDLWCSDRMSLRPEITFGDDGETPNILIFSMSTLEWGARVGGYSGILYKKIWQDAVLRRTITDSSRLTFCIADECHEVYSSSDARFTSLSRGKRGCTFYLTQNISNLRAVVGSEDLLDSFLANMNLKLFCANNGPTNRYMSELIGVQETLKPSWGNSENRNGGEEGSRNKSMNFSYEKEYHIRPDEIYNLRRGSPEDDGIVEAIAFAGGRPFAGNRDLPWMKVSFLADWKRREQQQKLMEGRN